MKNSVHVERAIKRMTQQQLATLVGVSRQTIVAIESGKYVPSTVLSMKIASVFEKPLESIFTLEESDWQ
ncbi:MAG: helix-turn-helix transcriptional regulator [Bacteroidales bacterium]|uniref:helix-turn-helix transcriptional regulator n=1 Tax=Sodaliphilus sp. TaxID=2815818 RepID=UPI0026F4DC14|nr:helix-turn-helix transcriptional regulator [Bacteroidales bacterium]